MTKFIVALLALTASLSVNANTTCHPNCVQTTTNLNAGEKVVDLRLASISHNDTVMTQLRIQTANKTKSIYNNVQVPVGIYQIAVDDKVVDAFCVDPFQAASTTNSKYIESKLDASDFATNGSIKFGLAQKLYDNAYGSLATASNAVKAGFHVALWEIFYDDLDTTKGNIKKSGYNRTNADVLSAANAFLTSLADSKWKITNTYDIAFYKSVCNQDFVVATLNPVSQVPLPAALPLLVSGLVGLGFVRRRKSA